MSDLLKLIQAYLAQANIRGIDPENPIPFFVRAPEGQPNAGKLFVVQVGYTEPTFSQLPYSVLWICYDQETSMYSKLYRRVSHNPSAMTPELNYNWVEITDYSQVFEKEQFYVPVADLDLVDGGDQVDPILVASTDAYGTVVTKENSLEPTAIISVDKRLLDPRMPLSHVHAEIPHSMLKVYQYEEPLVDEDEDEIRIGGEPIVEVKLAYVAIESAFPSEDGEILFIKEKDPKHDHVWIGEWRKATPADIEVTGPKVVSARIISPTESFGDNEQYDFDWEVTYDNSDVILMTPAWEVSENLMSIVIDTEGVLDIPNIEEDTQVTVTAKATYDGREFTDSKIIDIANTFVPVEPQRIEISGPKNVKELLPATYQVTLFMSDGTSAKVTPDSFVSDNTDAAIIDINGKMTTYDITENQPVTLTAEYTVEGQVFSATFDMTVLVEILDWNLEIRGAATIDELTQEVYEVYAVDEEGGETLITSPNTFEVSRGEEYVSLVGMQLSAVEVVGNHTITLRAEHIMDGVTKEVSKDVTVVDLSVYPQSIEVTFPSTLDEGDVENLALNIVYDDGSKSLLGNPDVVKFNKTNVLAYEEPLQITALTVTANTPVTITVEHTIAGVKVTGKHNVTVQNSVSAPTRLKPNQAKTYVNEKSSSVGFYLFVVNDDNSESPVTDFENVTLTPDGSHTLEITQEGNGWQIASLDSVVGGNHEMTLAVSYDYHGTILTLDHPIEVVDATKEVTAIEIKGATSVNEGGIVDLTVNLVKDDGTKEAMTSVTPVAVTQSPNGILTITKSGNKIKCTAPTNLTEDTVVTVTVEHDVNGVTLNDTHAITVNNTQKAAVDWVVTGDDQVVVGRLHADQYSYAINIEYDDGTFSGDARAAEWRITDNPNVIISNQDTGRISFTIKESEVTGEQTFTIEARSAITGTSVWKEKVVTIVPQDRSEIEFRLHGDTELNENAVSEEYVGQAHFGSHWVDNCNIKSLTIVGEAYGATIISGNILDSGKVTEERTITLRGVFDWAELVDQEATLQVTLKNNMIDFKSALFKQSGGEKPEGTEVNPTAVEVTMSNGTKRNLTAKSVTITKGATLVDVTGTGGSTRFTVKTGLAADGLVEWTGLVTVDGIDETVTTGSFTAKKLKAFVMKTCFGMALSVKPEDLIGDLRNILPLLEADYYFTELTDENAVMGRDIDLGMATRTAPAGTYPTYLDPAPFSTMYVISKVSWGRPSFWDGPWQVGNYNGARTYAPRDPSDEFNPPQLEDSKPSGWRVVVDAEESKPYDAHMWAMFSASGNREIAYIPYTDPNTGERYVLTRAYNPMTPDKSNPVAYPTILRFLPWEIPVPDAEHVTEYIEADQDPIE